MFIILTYATCVSKRTRFYIVNWEREIASISYLQRSLCHYHFSEKEMAFFFCFAFFLSYSCSQLALLIQLCAAIYYLCITTSLDVRKFFFSFYNVSINYNVEFWWQNLRLRINLNQSEIVEISSIIVMCHSCWSSKVMHTKISHSRIR